MKCWRCGNELTTGDAPNSAQCRRCEEARISSLVREQDEIALTDAAPKAPRKARLWRCHHPLGQWTRPESEIDDDCMRCHQLKRVAANPTGQDRPEKGGKV